MSLGQVVGTHSEEEEEGDTNDQRRCKCSHRHEEDHVSRRRLHAGRRDAAAVSKRQVERPHRDAREQHPKRCEENFVALLEREANLGGHERSHPRPRHNVEPVVEAQAQPMQRRLRAPGHVIEGRDKKPNRAQPRCAAKNVNESRAEERAPKIGNNAYSRDGRENGRDERGIAVAKGLVGTENEHARQDRRESEHRDERQVG
mmetsp:Transcript_2786/g.9843  ORF Transcript_2786/g.9843 Transcript_2786/m.9843 type:complete len:202 (+) Transcript_2786:546-1151(+)